MLTICQINEEKQEIYISEKIQFIRGYQPIQEAQII